MRGHTDSINTLTISIDGKFIVSSSSDNSMKLWNRREAKIEATFKGNLLRVKSVAVTNGEKYIILCLECYTASIWNFEKIRQLDALSIIIIH